MECCIFVFMEDTTEIWKIISENNHYEISSFGRIRSTFPPANPKRKDRPGRGTKYRKIRLTKQGYPHISIRVDQKLTILRLHRLVAEAFIPNPENKPYVNHIDGNKKNNNVSNLEWVTPKENSEHAQRLGKYGIGSANKMSILNEKAVNLIKNMLDYGISNSNIAQCFNVNSSVISLIKTNKSWKHVKHHKTS